MAPVDDVYTDISMQEIRFAEVDAETYFNTFLDAQERHSFIQHFRHYNRYHPSDPRLTNKRVRVPLKRNQVMGAEYFKYICKDLQNEYDSYFRAYNKYRYHDPRHPNAQYIIHNLTEEQIQKYEDRISKKQTTNNKGNKTMSCQRIKNFFRECTQERKRNQVLLWISIIALAYTNRKEIVSFLKATKRRAERLWKRITNQANENHPVG